MLRVKIVKELYYIPNKGETLKEYVERIDKSENDEGRLIVEADDETIGMEEEKANKKVVEFEDIVLKYEPYTHPYEPLDEIN